MGIFSVIVLVPIILVCALLGICCLKAAKQTVSLASVTIFTGVGGIVGVVTIIGWGFIFSDSGGMLSSTAKVVGMFIVAGILAVIGGLYAPSTYSKHKN